MYLIFIVWNANRCWKTKNHDNIFRAQNVEIIHTPRWGGTLKTVLSGHDKCSSYSTSDPCDSRLLSVLQKLLRLKGNVAVFYPHCFCSSPPLASSSTPAGYPTIQLNSDIIYLELASDLAIWGFNPKRLPPLKMLTAFYRLPDVKNWLIGKDPDAGKDWSRRRRGRQRMRWVDGITDSMDVSLSKLGEWWWTGRPGVLRSTGSQESDMTELLDSNRPAVREEFPQPLLWFHDLL